MVVNKNLGQVKIKPVCVKGITKTLGFQGQWHVLLLCLVWVFFFFIISLFTLSISTYSADFSSSDSEDEGDKAKIYWQAAIFKVGDDVRQVKLPQLIEVLFSPL